MMWKTFIFLAVASAVLAGKINRRDTKYEFHIKHDYGYLKHHEKSDHQEPETEHIPQEDLEQEQQEEKKEEEVEVVNDEPEQTNESEVSNDESSEEEVNDEDKEYPGYEFSYKVVDPHTHDIKGQHEKKYDGAVKGVYWLLQPDGYKRTVDYYADKHKGFEAKVDYSKFEGHHEENSKPRSEYYVKTYRGHKKYIPVTEEQEEQEEQEEGEEQDRQEESAQHIPIYVI